MRSHQTLWLIVAAFASITVNADATAGTAKPPAAPAASRPVTPAPTATPGARNTMPPTNPAAAGRVMPGASPPGTGPLQTGVQPRPGATSPPGVVRAQPTPGNPQYGSARGPVVAPTDGRSVAAPARQRPGAVVAGQAANPSAGAPQAGLKERPPYKVGAPGNENWPSNRGFESAKPGQLKPGQVVDRVGPPTGTFVSPAGTPTEKRGLPPGSQTKEYGMYQVKKPIDVTTGTAKPAFSAPGGGKQIELPKSVDQHVKAGDLKRWPPDPVPANAAPQKTTQSQTSPTQAPQAKTPQTQTPAAQTPQPAAPPR